MNRPNLTTPLMTEAHWRLYETALGTCLRLAATIPHQTAPWQRPEAHDRRQK